MGCNFFKYALLLAIAIFFTAFNAGALDVFSLFKKECGKKPSIAIIGAGIGGTSCAYFLTDLFGKDVYIDIFEAGEVGGRLQTQLISGIEVELGGDVLHPNNRYMKQFVKKFGLEVEPAHKGKLGIFNGEEFIILQSGWSVVDYFRMIYRYGLANTFRFYNHIQFILDNVDRAYDDLEEGFNSRSTKKLLEYMHLSFPEMRNVTVEEAFRWQFGDLMYEEMILPILRANYGQGDNLHNFAGSMALTGMMPGMWKVKDGTHRVAEELLKASSALIMRAPVYHVQYNEFDRQYVLSFPRLIDNAMPQAEVYDVVVVAAPITDYGEYPIKFSSNILSDTYMAREYHYTYVTIIEGKVDYEIFNCSDRPTEIYMPHTYEPFHSMTRLTKDNAVIELWKIISSARLNHNELRMFFEEDFEVRVEKVWEAYPEYVVPAEIELHEDSFFIQENLYYLNAVEWAATTIEMSVISAKNIAVIIHTLWERSYNVHSCFFCKGPENFWHK